MSKDANESPLNLSDDELDSFNWDEFIEEEPEDDQGAGAIEEESQGRDEQPDVEEQDIPEEITDPSTDDQEDPEGEEINSPDKEVIPSQESSEEEKKEDDSGEQEVDVEKEIPEADGVGVKPEPGSEGEEEEDKKSEDKEESLEPDYREEYNKILAPFKANGKMMQVEDAEDVRTLMQMGANYNKKMAGLKPNLKIVKLLENHDLLDEAKLSYLIDLDKKDPEAIKKLIKDSSLDVMELDTEQDSTYQPKTYTVNDKEVDLDSILEEIQDTESYETTLDIISNKWDESSRKTLYESPDIIPIINDQVANGVFEQIISEMEKERMLGRLKGLSDLNAYKKVGDDLSTAGKLRPIDSTANVSQENAPDLSVSKTTKPKVVDPRLKDKKRAASSTKSSGKNKEPAPGFNPLNMSDEDFEKQGVEKFL